MHPIITSFVCVFLLACGGSAKPARTPDIAPASSPDIQQVSAPGGQPCSQEIALVCPDGQIDACLVTPPAAEQHTCVQR
jgi:hypothetical protein